MRTKRLALTALVTCALTACGSTVQGLGSSTSGGSELSLGGGSSSTGGSSGVPGGTGPGSALGGTNSGTGLGVNGVGFTTGSGGGTLNGSNSTAPGSVVGITDKAVYVGIVYSVNSDAADAAIGAGTITSGDQRADAQAVVDDINAHGGIAGRKLVPVWHAVDTTSQDTYTNQDNQACGDLTQDNHIFVTAGGGQTSTFTACIERAGASVVSSGQIYGPDISDISRYPDYYEINTAVRERLLSYEVTALARQKYFTGWNATAGRASSSAAKVGVITYDRPDYTPAVSNSLLPALANAGHPVASKDVARIYSPNRTAALSTSAQQMQSAVLRLRQDGVTHVILDDTSGTLTLLFAEHANSQHWYPRLGVNTSSAAEVFFEGHEVSKQQLNGAVGLGWMPSIDLSADLGNKYRTPATTYCLKVMKERTGQTYTSTNAATLALGYCDSLYLIRDAINAIRGPITRTSFRLSVEAMGAHHVFATNPGTYLGPSAHHAAINAGYDMVFDSGCPCVRYVGAHTMPS